ncbi:tetratricopeptide repeat protein [Hasllibacter sp. MH4015]|uniref:tetratricopeptide repeat protein n=1 Tax=Hasllibacter sp. MH4015 TaxID=2854029 RepID=UPI001CD7988D|nr:tetratricopeptide repeat protein [Hasllibacter sp. MH4015]
MKTLIAAGLLSVTATLAPVYTAQAQDAEMAGIELFQSYMDIAEQFVGFATEQEATVFLAVEGIVEIFEERGEEAAAIPILQSALAQYPDDQPARNIIRFKLRDLYRDTGQADAALAELQAILDENS